MIDPKNSNDKSAYTSMRRCLYEGGVGIVSGVAANTLTTPGYVAWTKRQLNMRTLQIFREMLCVAGAKELINVGRKNFTMSVLHSSAYFSVVRAFMLYLEPTEYSQFTKGCMAGLASSFTETIATTRLSWMIATMANNNKANQPKYNEKQLLSYFMRSQFFENTAEKESLFKLEFQRYRRALLVTQLKNGLANPTTMGIAYGCKVKLDHYHPGSRYNAFLAGVLGGFIASPFFIWAVVLQTYTFNHIDTSIWQNLKTICKEHGLWHLLTAGVVLRPMQKGLATGTAFAVAQGIDDICKSRLGLSF